MRARASKNGDPSVKVKAALDAARRRTLERVRASGTVAKTKFRLMTIARYKELHDNRHPREDGHTTMRKTLDGEEVEVVAVRVTPAGEWEYNIEESDRFELRDMMDDGKQILRATQQEDKHKQLVAGMTTELKAIAYEEQRFLSRIIFGLPYITAPPPPVVDRACSGNAPYVPPKGIASLSGSPQGLLGSPLDRHGIGASIDPTRVMSESVRRHFPF